MKTILLFLILTINSYSQEYVTPEELEEGWGFNYLHGFHRFEAFPKNEIYHFYLSPDEKRIFVLTNILDSTTFKNYSYNMNLETNEIIEPDWNLRTFCTLNSEYCIYYRNFINILINGEHKYNLCNGDCESVTERQCYIGNIIIKNEEGIFTYLLNNIENELYEIYRVNVDKLIEIGCPEYEFISNVSFLKNYQQNLRDRIHFPINSADFIVEPIYEFNYTSGFNLYKDFQFEKEVILPKKENWGFSNQYDFNKYHPVFLGNSYVVGKEGDVYCWVSYRDSSELKRDATPYSGEAAREARDASGIYRIDTNGQNAVQLVRSWPYNPGGL